jgi:cellulose synthase (UDP-forming)
VETHAQGVTEALNLKQLKEKKAIATHANESSGERPLATTVPVMTAAQRRTYRIHLLVWIVLQIAFWTWWLKPTHILTFSGILLTSLAITFTFTKPAYFLFFLGRMRKINPALHPPSGLRVTFATTYVPGSESIETLERTVTAMRDQDGYHFDVWVLDEGDTPEVKELCARLGLSVFSRKNTARYQSTSWPFKRKTKAGNYNAWLDWLAERGIHYDILVQMDTDHVPQPGYLIEMLRPFADPDVAYVAAPSIVTGNREESWVVEARYFTDAAFNGPQQMGYNAGFAPIIVGSHAAFRLSALYHIGGFQRTLAEDHHNTLRLNAEGYWGAFNPDAYAIGDAAGSYTDSMVQQRQWARATTQILFTYFPSDCLKLSRGKRVQLGFTESWHVVLALTHLVVWLLPIVALITQQPWAQVSFTGFLAAQAVLLAWGVVITAWAKRHGWYRPAEIKPFSWRAMLHEIARWPHVLLGVLEALVSRFTTDDFEFAVTPKGGRVAKSLPLRVLAPYYLIIAGSWIAVAQHLFRGGPSTLDVFMFVAVFSAVMHTSVLAMVVFLNALESIKAGADARSILRSRAYLVPALGVIGSLAAMAFIVSIMLSGVP